MERNVMGELSMHRAAGTKPNFSDIARRHGLDRHTVAKYWREGEEVEDRRSGRESAFERVRPIVEAKAVLPGATKKGVHEMLLHLPEVLAVVHEMLHDRIPGLQFVKVHDRHGEPAPEKPGSHWRRTFVHN